MSGVDTRLVLTTYPPKGTGPRPVGRPRFPRGSGPGGLVGVRNRVAPSVPSETPGRSESPDGVPEDGT